jgi:hypothetical protein
MGLFCKVAASCILHLTVELHSGQIRTYYTVSIAPYLPIGIDRFI